MGFLSAVKDFVYIAFEKIKSGFIAVKNALTRFFEKALSFMKAVVQKIKEKIRKPILGAAHFFRKVGNKYQEGTKNYSVDSEIGEWEETTVTRDISIEDVPPKYRTMESEFEENDTLELEAAMG